jgi:hypothetical protein
MVLLLYTKSKHVWYCYCSANSVVLDFLLQNLLRKKKRKRKNKFTVGITCLLSFRFLSIGLIYWSRCREGERRRQFGKERIQFPLFVSAAASFFFLGGVGSLFPASAVYVCSTFAPFSTLLSSNLCGSNLFS